MPVYLDDQPLNLRAESLGAVLDAAAKKLGERGRIVAQVELGGQVLDDEQLSACRSSSLGTQELRLLSADPRELVLASIPDVCRELEALGPMQAAIAQLLQQDHRRQAMAKLPQVLAVWQRAQQLLGYALALLGKASTELNVDGKDPQQSIEALAQQLRGARELLEAADAVALADALAYEWPRTAEHWGRLLQAVGQRLKPT
jgi:hypothetical protein